MLLNNTELLYRKNSNISCQSEIENPTRIKMKHHGLSNTYRSHQAVMQMINSPNIKPDRQRKMISFNERLDRKSDDLMICGILPLTPVISPQGEPKRISFTRAYSEAKLKDLPPTFNRETVRSGFGAIPECSVSKENFDLDFSLNSSKPLNQSPILEPDLEEKIDPPPLIKPIEKFRKAVRRVMFLRRFGLLGDSLKMDANLFGKCEVTTKKYEDKHKRCCMIIMPGSSFKSFWNFLYILCLTFTIIFVPVRLAFLETISFQMMMLEYSIDCFFFLDVFVNFLSAYFDDNHILVTEKREIAKNYVKSWFIFDLLACFPLSLFERERQPEHDYNKLLRLFRLGKLYRLAKILNTNKMFTVLKRNPCYEKIMVLLKMNSGIKRLIKAICAYFLAIHFFACLWFYIARYDNFHPETWVVRYGIRDLGYGTQYLLSFYWSMTLTTIGYGDIIPYTNAERILALLYIIVGVGFVSYTIGALSTIMLSSDTKTQKLKEKMVVLDELAMSLKMSSDLYYRIKTILRNNHQTHFYSDMTHETLLEELPTNMRSQLITLIFKQNNLDSIAFFQGKSPEFLHQILPLLKRVSLAKDELIYRSGDWVDERDIKLVSTDEFMFRQYIAGSYFGETDLLCKKNFRSESALAGDTCELLVLKKGDLERLMGDHQDARNELKTVMEKRDIKNQESLELARKRNIKLSERLREKLNSGMKTIFNADYATHFSAQLRKQAEALGEEKEEAKDVITIQIPNSRFEGLIKHEEDISENNSLDSDQEVSLGMNPNYFYGRSITPEIESSRSGFSVILKSLHSETLTEGKKLNLYEFNPHECTLATPARKSNLMNKQRKKAKLNTSSPNKKKALQCLEYIQEFSDEEEKREIAEIIPSSPNSGEILYTQLTDKFPIGTLNKPQECGTKMKKRRNNKHHKKGKVKIINLSNQDMQIHIMA